MLLKKFNIVIVYIEACLENSRTMLIIFDRPAIAPVMRRGIHIFFFHENLCCGPVSVAQLDAPSDWRPGDRGFNPHRGRQHSFMEIDHEIFSTVILSLPLIQEGQLSVSGERMCTILVNRLED